VVTDAGWMSYDRQIGTTGVSVNPELYLAFGISGAAQHVGGLGAPEHVVSVNTDPSCPMTAMSDLGIVADAPAVLSELAKRLGVTGPDGAAVPDGTGQPTETARPQEAAQRREGASHDG
jgi:electron transfer flavoprotein alpha subunit